MSELNQVVTATETAVAKKRGIALGTKLGPRALTNAEPVIERTITEVDGVKTITVKTVAVVGSPTAAGIKAAAFLSATGKVPEKYTDQATLVQKILAENAEAVAPVAAEIKAALEAEATAAASGEPKVRGRREGTKMPPRALTDEEGPTAAGIKAAAALKVTGNVPENYADQAEKVKAILSENPEKVDAFLLINGTRAFGVGVQKRKAKVEVAA